MSDNEVKVLAATSREQLEQQVNALRSQYVIMNVSHATNNKGSVTEYTAAVTVKKKANTLTEGN